MPVTDLSRLRIRRDDGPRRRWLPWAIAAALAALAIGLYPYAGAYLAARRAPEVEIVRATRLPTTPGDAGAALPVLVASGYVVARRSSDVGGKVGGRIGYLGVEEGDTVRAGQVIARLEHADLDAQLVASRTAVDEARAMVTQTQASLAEDRRNLDRLQALRKDGIVTDAAVTGAQAAAEVSAARVESAQAALASALARVRVAEEAIENTNVRAPFDGVVIAKRAEVGETVSPFGVMGQATRDGGAIAKIADLSDLEVQTEISETNVAKLGPRMAADVRLQAYPDMSYEGRLRQIFPAADRAKAIVEARVTIVNADARVKPEMTATVTFKERAATAAGQHAASNEGPLVLIPKRAVVTRGGQTSVWVVIDGTSRSRAVSLGTERLDQIEVRSGIAPGEAVILNPPEGVTDGGLVKVRGQR